MGRIAADMRQSRHRHRRQSAQREARGDPRRDPGRRARRARDRRPGRGDPRRRAPARPRRCAADRRQGPRDRPDRRLHRAAVLGSRGGAGRPGGDADQWLSRSGNGTSWWRRRRATPRARRPLRITGFSIDTRTLQPGDVFVALKDERDGHEFVAGRLQGRRGRGPRRATAIARSQSERRAAARRRSAARAGSASAAPRAPAPTRASSPSPAASARPAPRRCCALCLALAGRDACGREVLQQPLGRAADAGAHAAPTAPMPCSRSA